MGIRTYEELIGKHEGECCFICGAGPSLYNWCSSYRQRDIFEHVVISVNSSIMVMHWDEGEPNKRYWVSNDALCRRWSWWEDVKKAKCTKVVRDSWLKYKDELEDFIFFSPRLTSEGIVNAEDKGLAYCSSVPTSIDLAIQMGCKKIFLLGVDHCKCSWRTHYYELLWENEPEKLPKQVGGSAQQSWEGQKKVFEFNNMAYKALHDFAIDRSVEIYNCSTCSEVKEFLKPTYNYAFEIIKRE